MKTVALAFGLASVTLFGCGGGPPPTSAPTPAGPSPTLAPTSAPTPAGPSPTPAPTSAPYNPQNLGEAWANHGEAVGSLDADKIMLDYDDDSVLAVFNDACNRSAGEEPYAEYKGQQIKGFFESLFTRLAVPNKTVLPVFTGGDSNPFVEPKTGPLDATANVFLVWKSPDEGFGPSTDCFLWKAGYKIMKQNIVTTEPSACANSATRVEHEPTEQMLESEERRLKASKIEDAWENHLASFGAQNMTTIMYDYLDTSTIRVFDSNGDQYSVHTGLLAIKTMFEGLFAAINAAQIGESTGVEVRELKVEPQYNSVLLVWKSFSHPKATDTFLFDDEGKIVRQNIVVTTKSNAAAKAWV